MVSFSAMFLMVLLNLGHAAAQPSVSDSSSSTLTLVGNSQNRSLPNSPRTLLLTYEDHSRRQGEALTGYTAVTVVAADLLDTYKRGEFELRIEYVAPASLRFTPLRFDGSQFVKTNVISRLLRSEVQQAEDTQHLLALTSSNYQFDFKRTELINGKLAAVYKVKPRKRTPGLFKGEIYLHAATGVLMRTKGTITKSPSFFVRHVAFVQDYAEFDSFTMPVHLHSMAKVRLLGRVLVDITTSQYAVTAKGAAAPDGAISSEENP